MQFLKWKCRKNGLVIDIENQSKLTDKRIADWCEQLKKEFL